jgi:hypothetical protein
MPHIPNLYPFASAPHAPAQRPTRPAALSPRGRRSTMHPVVRRAWHLVAFLAHATAYAAAISIVCMAFI